MRVQLRSSSILTRHKVSSCWCLVRIELEHSRTRIQNNHNLHILFGKQTNMLYIYASVHQ